MSTNKYLECPLQRLMKLQIIFLYCYMTIIIWSRLSIMDTYPSWKAYWFFSSAWVCQFHRGPHEMLYGNSNSNYSWKRSHFGSRKPTTTKAGLANPNLLWNAVSSSFQNGYYFKARDDTFIKIVFSKRHLPYKKKKEVKKLFPFIVGGSILYAGHVCRSWWREQIAHCLRKIQPERHRCRGNKLDAFESLMSDVHKL